MWNWDNAGVRKLARRSGRVRSVIVDRLAVGRRNNPGRVADGDASQEAGLERFERRGGGVLARAGASAPTGAHLDAGTGHALIAKK
jgi:hypothetical protein